VIDSLRSLNFSSNEPETFTQVELRRAAREIGPLAQDAVARSIILARLNRGKPIAPEPEPRFGEMEFTAAEMRTAGAGTGITDGQMSDLISNARAAWKRPARPERYTEEDLNAAADRLSSDRVVAGNLIREARAFRESRPPSQASGPDVLADHPTWDELVNALSELRIRLQSWGPGSPSSVLWMNNVIRESIRAQRIELPVGAVVRDAEGKWFRREEGRTWSRFAEAGHMYLDRSPVQPLTRMDDK
jgi:hypothetical protein